MGTNAIRGAGPSPLPMLGSGADVVSAELGGDINAQVAAMMMMGAREKRQLVQQSRRAEDRMVQAMEERQVASMRAQATQIRAAGVCKGVGQIVSGGLAVAGGACTIASSGMSGDAAPAIDPKTGASQSGSGAGIDAGQVLGAAGTIMPKVGAVAEGIGELAAAGHDAAAKNRDADSTEAGNRADASKRRLENLRDDEKDAQEMTRTAIDFLRDINQSAAGADRAAIFQRA